MSKLQTNDRTDDWRCYCCGRHVSELKPFGKEGDPLAGNFNGQLLVGVHKWVCPDFLELEKLWEDHLNGNLHEIDEDSPECQKNKEIFIHKYGKNLYNIVHYCITECCHSGDIIKVPLCRDCVTLDDDEYFEKREEVWHKKHAAQNG